MVRSVGVNQSKLNPSVNKMSIEYILNKDSSPAQSTSSSPTLPSFASLISNLPATEHIPNNDSSSAQSASIGPTSPPSVNKMPIDFLLNGPTLPRISQKDFAPLYYESDFTVLHRNNLHSPLHRRYVSRRLSSRGITANNFGHDSKLT